MLENKKLKVIRPIRSYSENIRFEYPGRLTEREAELMQGQAGYISMGYGFVRFKPSDTLTTWECYQSCE